MQNDNKAIKSMNDVQVEAAQMLLEEMREVKQRVTLEKGRADMLAKLGAVISQLKVIPEMPDFTSLLGTGIGVPTLTDNNESNLS